ncbi:unnamed protein product [Lathyrus oleraceus]
METICICKPTSSSHNGVGIFRSKRNLPPADYLFKIQSYSLLMNKKYESGVFQAGGYKWKLVLHPGDNSRSDENGYVSLFLKIVETEKLPYDWKVNVNFKLFVVDQKHANYLTIQDAGDAVRTFSEKKTKWGFEQLISLRDFKNSSNGYLVRDFCEFGAEIFVIHHSNKSESLYMIKNPTKDSFSWTLENFSTLNGLSGYDSRTIAVGERDWSLRVYPRGSDNETRDEYLSLYLELKNCGANKTVFASYTLKILDQRHDKYYHETGSGWFRPSGAASNLVGATANKIFGATAAAKDMVKASASKWFGPSVVDSNLVKGSVNMVYGATVAADKYIGASATVNNWIGSDNIKGFTKFISLSELNKKTNGYVKNNAIIMEVDIHVTRIRTSY